MHGLDSDGVARLGEAMAAHADDGHRGDVGGIVWLVARGDEVAAGSAGRLSRDADAPVRRDSLFRISSMTKPVAAVAALVLVEEGTLRLDAPVDDLLPELADRRVLVDPRGPVDGPTRPANRAITLHDVLTFQLGLGMDFAAPWPQPLLEAMEALGFGSGPPEPQRPPAPDEWMRRLSTLPLLYDPGERWLYNTGSDVLGVIIARASGQPLDVFLRERVLGPLGMVDTSFATTATDRLGSSYIQDPTSGERVVYDPPDGQWATPPAFPSAAGGLLSTVDDMLAFGRMLLAGGRLPDGSNLITPDSVAAMTTDHIGAATGAPGPSPDGTQGWGFGVGVQVRDAGPGRAEGSYGWSGGLGSSWSNDPRTGLIGVLLTTDAFTAAYPPPAVIEDFWTATAAVASRRGERQLQPPRP